MIDPITIIDVMWGLMIGVIAVFGGIAAVIIFCLALVNRFKKRTGLPATDDEVR